MFKFASWLFVLAVMTLIAITARGGHEVPIYPSYYPHEIAIETVSPERAAGLLLENKIQAYLGHEPRFSGDMPASIREVDSLGSFIIFRANPNSPLAKDTASTCATIGAIVRDIAGKKGFVFHPYPVTPFHGDYLYHVDLAAAAKARILRPPADGFAPAMTRPRVKATGALANLVRPDWMVQGPEWDVAIEEVDAADLVASSMTAVNGWLGGPWIKAGWFHAELLLSDVLDDAETKRRADAALQRLEASEDRDMVERVNLERELVTAVTGNCRKIVAGYTVKRQYFSGEFTDGIENVGFDSIAGLSSPMFFRTVKLKDFPWNGWLSLGIDSSPGTAWNPIAGFTDPFGRLLWYAVGDPALLYAPYDSGWMLNRISDVQSNSGR
jgi:hypothetical protein